MTSARRLRRTLPGACTALALALCAPAARAQAPQPESANNAAAAQARFDAGRTRFEQGDLAGALTEFRASLELFRSPNTRLYIGLCLARLDRAAEAFNELTRAGNEAADLARTDRRYEATRDRARRELGPLESRIARMTLRVVDAPPNLRVRAGSTEIAAQAFGVALAFDPGAVEVVAEAPGHAPFRQTVRLAPGATASIDVGLRPLRAAASVTPPVIPVTPVAPTEGAPRRGGGVRTAGIVVGALGLAGLGVFIGFGIRAQNRYDDLRTACRLARCPPSNNPWIDEGEQWQTIANAGLGAGIGLIVAGAVMIAVGGPTAATETPPRRARVDVWGDPSRGMLGVAGAF